MKKTKMDFHAQLAAGKLAISEAQKRKVSYLDTVREVHEHAEFLKIENGGQEEQMVAACWGWIGSAMEYDNDEHVWQLDPGVLDPIKSAANDRLRNQASSFYEHEAQYDLAGPAS